MIRGVYAHRLRQLIERDLIFFQPIPIRLTRGQTLFDFFIGNDPPLDGIYQKHLARLQSAFAFHLLRWD